MTPLEKGWGIFIAEKEISKKKKGNKSKEQEAKGWMSKDGVAVWGRFTFHLGYREKNVMGPTVFVALWASETFFVWGPTWNHCLYPSIAGPTLDPVYYRTLNAKALSLIDLGYAVTVLGIWYGAE